MLSEILAEHRRRLLEQFPRVLPPDGVWRVGDLVLPYCPGDQAGMMTDEIVQIEGETATCMTSWGPYTAPLDSLEYHGGRPETQKGPLSPSCSAFRASRKP